MDYAYCGYKKKKTDKMINIKNPSDCCGCTACASICAHDAISMKPDALGFLYPEVEKDKCVDCGLCEKVCPQINADHILSFSPAFFAFRTSNDRTLENSSSGGGGTN